MPVDLKAITEYITRLFSIYGADMHKQTPDGDWYMLLDGNTFYQLGDDRFPLLKDDDVEFLRSKAAVIIEKERGGEKLFFEFYDSEQEAMLAWEQIGEGL